MVFAKVVYFCEIFLILFEQNKYTHCYNSAKRKEIVFSIAEM